MQPCGCWELVLACRISPVAAGGASVAGVPYRGQGSGERMVCWLSCANTIRKKIRRSGGAAPIRGTKRPWVAQFLHILLLEIEITTVTCLMVVHNCTGFE